MHSLGTPLSFAEHRLSVLLAALRAFAETGLDYQALLDVVGQKLAEIVKDGCVVRLLGEDGWLLPVAIHIPFDARVDDAETAARLRAHIAVPRNVTEQDSARRVLETGEPLLISHLELSHLQPGTSAEIVQVYKAIGIHSLLLVALRVRGESIGLLSLVRFEPSSPSFADEDCQLAQALADHAALAISNARLTQSALQ